MNLNYIKAVAQKKIIELENNIDFLETTLVLYGVEQSNDIIFQIKDYEDKHSAWKRILQCLKYKQVLDKQLIKFIERELNNLGISNIDRIKLLEFIKIHNATYAKDRAITGKDLTFIIKLLNQEFKVLAPVSNKNSETLDLIVSHTISLLDNNDLSTVQSAMNLDKIYDDEDLVYIYTKVLKHYQDDLEDFANMLKNENFSFSIQMIHELRNDYELVYQRYLFILQKYNQLMTRKDSEEDILSLIEESYIKSS